MPIPPRLNKPRASRLLNSICGPNPGCGDAHPRRLAIVVASFPIAFEEWSTSSRIELRIVGSKELNLRVGDKMPAMAFLKTDGTQITEQDLIANAPALLTLYRGWWCPSSKVQLHAIMENHEHLNKKGVSMYAASVDEPETASAIQEHVGNTITILCSVSEEVLKKVGVLDKKGAPWYDRIIFGAPERPIAMPATIVINKDGRIIFASRSIRVDEGPRVDEILASLSLLP